jgi:Uma2 family endonuclease
MATVSMSAPTSAEPQELHSGDRMTREEFHRIYAAMPEDFKAELIGGIVYVASPLKIAHATHHSLLATLFTVYAGNTPGVQTGDNATIILADEEEPQPDQYLRVLPEWGGQSATTADDYVSGAPELLAEIAHSSRAIDLHAKRESYARFGVREYLVLCLREQQLRWFDLRTGQEQGPDADGVFRLRLFPDLWIQGAALVANAYQPAMAALNAGLATPDHAAFAARLAAQHASRSAGEP